jgi:hypothetical protein
MKYKNPLAVKSAKKAWYERNKEDVKRKAREKRNERDKFIRDYKLLNSVCADCGISYPPHMLDFDHIIGTKSFGINRGARNKTLSQIKEEIKKCEIVCANCHRHRTYMRPWQSKLVSQ